MVPIGLDSQGKDSVRTEPGPSDVSNPAINADNTRHSQNRQVENTDDFVSKT